jgi:hypothetical protein
MTEVVLREDFLQHVYIARCNFDFKMTCSGPEGEISDFNIWDRALSLEELEDWTTCKAMTKGNLVNWETAEFDTINMTATQQTTESICVPVRPGNVIFPNRRNFSSVIDLCGKMKSKVSVIKTEEQQQEMIDKRNQQPTCGPLTDRE